MNEKLDHACVLINGASGLIGTNFVKHIHAIAPTCHIIAFVHSMEEAKQVLPETEWLTIVETDVNQPVAIDGKIDYIIHGVSITSSKMIVDVPEKTILTSANGTRNMLELTREKQVRSFLFLCTMEIYGTPQKDDKITEDAA